MNIRLANWLWTKTPLKWRWIKIADIMGGLGILLVLLSGGRTNAFGLLGLAGIVGFVLITVVSLVLYPIAETSIERL